MANPAVLALTFAALLALTSVSAFRTSVFTTTIDDEGYVVFTRSSREQKSSCRKEIQPEQLNDCQKYLDLNSPYSGEVLEMSVVDPRRQQEKKELEQCCEELRNVKEECQCEAVKEAFRLAEQQQQGGSRRGSQSERQQRQILQKAQNLPSECRLKTQQCRIRSPWI